ncbi:MAG: type IV toxin-antitoxin system AbiEi family antitoxin [Candidatus Methylomirabilales bacterium]
MKDPRPEKPEYSRRLLELLAEVPLVRLDKKPRGKRPSTGSVPDRSIDVLVGEDRWELILEMKSSGEPRLIRGAIHQLQSDTAASARVYGVVSAPYLGERAQELCKEARIGYLDLAGNCRLAFSSVFIERKGFPNTRVERRPLRTLFAPKASRILRILVTAPKRTYRLQELAKLAGVSLGLAFKVKERLLDLEYAREEKNGLRVNRPEDLLREWTRNYEFGKHTAVECYAMGEVAETERKLAAWCAEKRVPYAFTLFSGAARVAPFARYLRSSAYVMTDPEKMAERLGWKVVPTGANVILLRPFDEGVLYGAQEVDGERVVSNVQLYLDLASQRARGGEAATFLLEQRLRPAW